MVVDCGGGTIDISTYTRASDRSLKEISAAECTLLMWKSTSVANRLPQVFSKDRRLSQDVLNNTCKVPIAALYFALFALIYLTLGYLHESRFGGPEEIATMKRFFDKTTKTSFRNASKPSFIKFGKGSDNDPDLNIKAGGLKLSGQVL